MQIIFGNLSRRDLDSFLNPQNDWLLLAGFPDPQQAAVAATNFIVNIRHLPDGAAVIVTGIPTAVGAQPAIIMTDINPAGELMSHAAAHPLFRERLAAKPSRAAGCPAAKAKAKTSANSRARKNAAKKTPAE
jgi:hypothetical protein